MLWLHMTAFGAGVLLGLRLRVPGAYRSLSWTRRSCHRPDATYATAPADEYRIHIHAADRTSGRLSGGGPMLSLIRTRLARRSADSEATHSSSRYGLNLIVFVAIAMLLQTPSSTWTEDPIKNFRLASHAYVECSLTTAAQLASQPEIPELIAIAALKRCAGEAEQSRERAIPIAGEGGSLAIMDEVNDLLREKARTIVVAIRDQAEQFQDYSHSPLPISITVFFDKPTADHAVEKTLLDAAYPLRLPPLMKAVQDSTHSPCGQAVESDCPAHPVRY
jgi:hypothetical protein